VVKLADTPGLGPGAARFVGSSPTSGINKIIMNNKQQKIIQKIAIEVKQKLADEGSGHDWWHILRVWNMAKRISVVEKTNIFTVELAALLHDIADWKFYNGDDTIGPKMARQILKKYSIPNEIITQV
jgi:uncharacterized protein